MFKFPFERKEREEYDNFGELEKIPPKKMLLEDWRLKKSRSLGRH